MPFSDVRHASWGLAQERDAAVGDAFEIVVALFSLFAEAVRILDLVGFQIGCALSIVAMLSNPTLFIVVRLFIVAWVLEIGVTWEIMQLCLVVLFLLINGSSGRVVILSLMMVISVWVKQCFLLVIWLQEDWILKVRSDIHGGLIDEHIIASLSGLEGASLGRTPHRSSIAFLLSSVVRSMRVAMDVSMFV